MKITFRPANRYERRVRGFHFNHSRPGNFLILLLIETLILPALFDTGLVGEIKIMSKIGGHATRNPHLVPRHA